MDDDEGKRAIPTRRRNLTEEDDPTMTGLGMYRQCNIGNGQEGPRRTKRVVEVIVADGGW